MKTLTKAAATATLLLNLTGCAIFRESPVEVSQFMDTNYAEHRADPGRVLAERVKFKHPTKAGEGFAGGPTLCGFVDFSAKIVWTARAYECPAEQTRGFERCHVDAHEQGVKDECHTNPKVKGYHGS